MNAESSTTVILLQPRPYANLPGRLVLLPLLPRKPPRKPLPSEIWTRVFEYLYAEYSVQRAHEKRIAAFRGSLLLICKTLTVRDLHSLRLV